MKKYKFLIHFVLFILFSSYGFTQNTKFQSAYTDINPETNCQTVKTYEDAVGTELDCGKFGDITIKIVSDDLRDSVDLIRDGKRYPLNFYQALTPHFSFLGKKMEWRFVKGQKTNPRAMIVRLNIDIEGETEKDRHRESYLVVSKITEKKICIVGKIPPQKNQNILAREMADKASSLSCILDRKNNKRIW